MWGLISVELPGKRGVKIIFVRPDSPAKKSGIKKGDILIEMGQKIIRDRNDFVEVIESIKANIDIRLMLNRKGRFMFLLFKALLCPGYYK